MGINDSLKITDVNEVDNMFLEMLKTELAKEELDFSNLSPEAKKALFVGYSMGFNYLFDAIKVLVPDNASGLLINWRRLSDQKQMASMLTCYTKMKNQLQNLKN